MKPRRSIELRTAINSMRYGALIFFVCIIVHGTESDVRLESSNLEKAIME